MMWGYGFNWPNIGLMMLGSFLVIVVLVVLGWAVMRALNRRTNNSTDQIHTLAGNGPTAAEILNQRYARGEIDAMTFEQMRERLGSSDDAQQRNRVDGHRANDPDDATPEQCISQRTTQRVSQE